MIARWFWREWRSPSLLIVWLALSRQWPVCWRWAASAIAWRRGLASKAANLWRATGRCKARAPSRRAGSTKRASGLKVGEQISFQTMTFAGDTPQLASVKAVDNIYPMYGELQTSPPASSRNPVRCCWRRD